MPTLAGFPFIDVHFDKDGGLEGANRAQQVVAMLKDSGTTDLIVMSHGWNNDQVDAMDLYKRFFADVRPAADSLGGTRKWGVAGVFWPSKKFGDKTLPAATPAAGFGSDHLKKALHEQLDTLSAVFPNRTEINAARKLVPDLEDSETARAKFVDAIRNLLRASKGNTEDSPPQFFSTKGKELIDRLGRPLAKSVASGEGGAALAMPVDPGEQGRAVGVASSVTGVLGGAIKFLNYATYYEMKERAATVGVNGLAPLLREVRASGPDVGLHLVGHSFGARLVTATVAGNSGEATLAVDTLVLLQAAFSHYGFAAGYDAKGSAGFFRRVLNEKLVRGPLVVSCTRNDEAVGTLYPLASLIANQVASEFGDANSPYGGLGANGAQKSDASNQAIHAPGTAYEWKMGAIHNLNADACIKDHSDICKPEVAYALVSSACARVRP
ncbi:hypothetical protein AWB80_08293 [Caballeronia pedi]|uniref:Serine-threonine protein kinase n=1 Tax=Caballeronia pedi TaxID=1777141 RepID=A0A158E5N9_9BURK|nr:hypothetical protein [Caballeronia pedi]SAL02159.1 hypothetical protein AWB80_08293 [Caballeronia pedi]